MKHPSFKSKIPMLLLGLLMTGAGSSATDRPAGFVVWWGRNIAGRSTDVPDSRYPTGLVTIAGQVLSNAVAVAAGMSHSLAIRSDGTVVGWGLNGRGQATGVASAPGESAAGGVTIDGKVLSNVVAVAAGGVHSQAVLRDGTVAAWGTRRDGGRMIVQPGLSNVISIAGWYPAAVKSDGTVVNILNGETSNGVSNIVAISAPLSDGPIWALKNDGMVVELPGRGVGPPSPAIMSNVTAIAAGVRQSLALKTDGTVFAWGSYTDAPSGLSNVVAIATGNWHSLALRQDGTVVAWGRHGLGGKPATVPAGLSNVVAIAAGYDFSLAITTNSAVAERFRR